MTGETLDSLHLCFEGAVPAVIATASADGTPNVTYLSRVRGVDANRIALSNQFFSKTQRNIAENPRASVLLVDPTTYLEFRLTVVYERTERRGPVFEQLRDDVDAVAALSGMQDVFRLRAADIYRVLHIERVVTAAKSEADWATIAAPSRRSRSQSAAPLAELTGRLSRCGNLDMIVSTTVDGLAELFEFEHSSLLLLDERGERLFTIASHGYPTEGVGSEVAVGDGIVGMAAERAQPIRLGGFRQLAKYGKSIRLAYEDPGVGPGHEIPIPELPNAKSRIAVPAMALGQLVGVLAVEDTESVAFTESDELLLTVVASVVANAIEADRQREAAEEGGVARAPARALPDPAEPATLVRFFPVDGSTFLDGDYLIKGVAGRILWSLLGHYDRERRVDFTNKEVRLDPTLELPDFRDNLDSRLILLKRRLDERDAPIRIEKTGRGRFRLVVDANLRLDEAGAN